MNTQTVDTLMNAERLEPSDRPVRIEPPLPDLEPPGRPWHGSVHDELVALRSRAERAEEEVALLISVLRAHRCACATPDRGEWLNLPFCRTCGVVLRHAYGAS